MELLTMKPLVSILIPAYNAERWLGETLRSAVTQTWDRKEIIVVNDGSEDRTEDLARGFESAGVTVHTQRNQGAAAARNKAFSLCKGDYIQWLDADDLLAPEKISKQMHVAENARSNRVLISGEWARFIYRSSRARFIPTGLWCDLTPTEWLMRKMEQNTYMQTATWLVSRELTEAAGPWDTRLLGDDDGEYFCRVLLASKGVRFVPGAKVFYRDAGSASLSYRGASNRQLEAQWLSMEMHIRYLLSHDDSIRARKACNRYLQDWSVIFYPQRLDLFNKANEAALRLGGQVVPPRLSWKYELIRSAFGWPAARRAQLILSRLKWSVARSWDNTLFRIGIGRRAADPAVQT
jgi:glycosyltransferase involved in cell wall biosynthesis